MGKQIRFFMASEDEEEFINKVIISGDSFIDHKGDRLATEDLKSYRKRIFIISPQSRIMKNDRGFINIDKSDVIEFERSIIREPKPEKTEIDIGKEATINLFLELTKLSSAKDVKYYPPLLNEEWQKKLDQYRSFKRFELGRLWIQTRYYSSYDINEMILSKDEWMIKRYEMYKRWIVKNYRINTYKSCYIGKFAYILYQRKEYKMMLGPILEAVFT